MSCLGLFLLLLIAGVAGALGQAIAGVSRGGCLMSIVLGFIGALLGYGLARAVGLPEPFMLELGGAEFPLLWSIIGSTLFVALISLLTRRRAWP